MNGDEVRLQRVEGGWILEYLPERGENYKRVFATSAFQSALYAVASYLNMSDSVEIRSSPSAGEKHV